MGIRLAPEDEIRGLDVTGNHVYFRPIGWRSTVFFSAWWKLGSSSDTFDRWTHSENYRRTHQQQRSQWNRWYIRIALHAWQSAWRQLDHHSSGVRLSFDTRSSIKSSPRERCSTRRKSGENASLLDDLRQSRSNLFLSVNLEWCKYFSKINLSFLSSIKFDFQRRWRNGNGDVLDIFDFLLIEFSPIDRLHRISIEIESSSLTEYFLVIRMQLLSLLYCLN